MERGHVAQSLNCNAQTLVEDVFIECPLYSNRRLWFGHLRLDNTPVKPPLQDSDESDIHRMIEVYFYHKSNSRNTMHNSNH